MFGAAERFDPDVAAKVEAVCGAGHGAFIGLSGFWIVEVAVFGVVGVGEVETGANLEAAELASV